MPWKVFKQDNGKYAVHKIDSDGQPVGKPLGMHDTEEEARQQQKALYANAPDAKALAVKFANPEGTAVEGLGMPWGGNFNGQDLAGEHFSAETDFAFGWFPSDGRPVLYHHGLNKDAGFTPVGHVTGYEVKADLGVWVKAQLDASNEYFGAIKDLIKKGKLFFSSGSMRHLVEVNAKSGEIKKWPWVEISLTPTPCNLLAELDFATAEKHFKAAGIKADLKVLQEGSDTAGGYLISKKPAPTKPTNQPTNGTDGKLCPCCCHPCDCCPDGQMEDCDCCCHDCHCCAQAGQPLKAELSPAAREGLESNDFAYIDSEGGKHLPIHDAAHVRNALARFDQTKFESEEAKSKARRKIEAAARKFDIETEASKKSVAVKAMDGSYEDLIEDLNNLVNPYSPFISDCYSYVCATFPDYCIVRRSERGEGTCWRVEYAIGPDGEPILGKAIEVEETFVPVRAPEGETESLITQAEKASRLAALITERAEALRDRRIKSGREVSSANHGHVQALHARMSAAHAEMGKHLADMAGFLERTDPNRTSPEAKAEMMRRQDVEHEVLRLFVASLPRTL